jgi:hypothetical protein
MHTKTETITPDRAKEYLAKQVGNQRPLSPRKIIQQCEAPKIPLFHKQLGSNPINVNLTNPGMRGENTDAWPEDLRVRQAPPALRAILESAQRLTKGNHETV